MRMSVLAGRVTERVFGSLREEAREVGALRRGVLETEAEDRCPWNRFEIEGKRRLSREVKLSVD